MPVAKEYRASQTTFASRGRRPTNLRYGWQAQITVHVAGRSLALTYSAPGLSSGVLGVSVLDPSYSPESSEVSSEEPEESVDEESSMLFTGLIFSVRWEVSLMWYTTLSPVERVASTKSPSG